MHLQRSLTEMILSNHNNNGLHFKFVPIIVATSSFESDALDQIQSFQTEIRTHRRWLAVLLMDRAISQGL